MTEWGQCDSCGEEFNVSENFTTHGDYYHSTDREDEDEEFFVCKDCQKDSMRMEWYKELE